MSVLKTALVLSVAIAILPSERAQQDRLFTTVSNAASWTATYCDRNPGHCTTAKSAWDVFVAKAQFAGEVVYGIAARHAFGSERAQDAAYSAAEPVRLNYLKTSPAGTLTSRDLEPFWRGRKASKGV